MSLEQPRLGFLGAGKMATALALGWLRTGLISANTCRAADPFPDARQSFQKATGIVASDDPAEVIAGCNVLLVAVKPQNMAELLRQLAGRTDENHLVISVAAGVSIQQISQALRSSPRIIRVMPNTPAVVQACAAAYSASDGATSDDVAFVDRLLNAVGLAVAVPEHLLDAVTGLSGSGPAYVFAIIEALSDGGVAAGLPRHVAARLATQTVLGAAKMVLETGEHPAVLREQVTSPAGTTMAGLRVLERAGVRSGLIEAVVAAAHRATELGVATHG
jgi:pyrroline-5-carboxylate reductase